MMSEFEDLVREEQKKFGQSAIDRLNEADSKLDGAIYIYEPPRKADSIPTWADVLIFCAVAAAVTLGFCVILLWISKP